MIHKDVPPSYIRYMEGGEGKKLNFRCHQIAVVEGTLMDEGDGAQTHRHIPTIHCMWLPTIHNTHYNGCIQNGDLYKPCCCAHRTWYYHVQLLMHLSSMGQETDLGLCFPNHEGPTKSVWTPFYIWFHCPMMVFHMWPPYPPCRTSHKAVHKS